MSHVWEVLAVMLRLGTRIQFRGTVSPGGHRYGHIIALLAGGKSPPDQNTHCDECSNDGESTHHEPEQAEGPEPAHHEASDRGADGGAQPPGEEQPGAGGDEILFGGAIVGLAHAQRLERCDGATP